MKGVLQEVLAGLLLAAIVCVVVVPALWETSKIERAQASQFKQVCESSGGTVVWDGRQRQCIIVKETK